MLLWPPQRPGAVPAAPDNLRAPLAQTKFASRAPALPRPSRMHGPAGAGERLCDRLPGCRAPAYPSSMSSRNDRHAVAQCASHIGCHRAGDGSGSIVSPRRDGAIARRGRPVHEVASATNQTRAPQICRQLQYGASRLPIACLVNFDLHHNSCECPRLEKRRLRGAVGQRRSGPASLTDAAERQHRYEAMNTA